MLLLSFKRNLVAAVLLVVSFGTTVEAAAQLPATVFWNNTDWPSDLTFPSSLTNNNNDDNLAPVVWKIDEATALRIAGPTALESSTSSSALRTIFQEHNEVWVRTYDGGWIGTLSLPSAATVAVGSKFLFQCDSSWGVTVQYSRNNQIQSRRINSGEALLLIVLRDAATQTIAWFTEEEYVPPPTVRPTVVPTAAPTTNADQEYDLFAGTVLFGQSHIIPSKHRLEGDTTHPHLTAQRTTLVLVRPSFVDDNTSLESTTEVLMTVRDREGTTLVADMVLADPTDIPKQAGWMDLGAGDDDGTATIEDVRTTIPDTLVGTRYVLQYQANLNTIGNDPTASGLVQVLTTLEAQYQNQVEIKTWNGSWVRNIYLPDGRDTPLPHNVKIQITCNSGYNVNVYYPNTQRNTNTEEEENGGISYRSHTLSNGQTLVAVLVNDGQTWMTKADGLHNSYIFGHNFYSATLKAEWVEPGMTLEFTTTPTTNEESPKQKMGVLEDIDIGGITELMITVLDAGLLTEPRQEFTFQETPTLHREYFETTLASRLIVVEYETIQLDEIMLPDGTFYPKGSRSDTDGGWHTGDMRQYIGKILLSHGIDFANYGISSSNGGSEQGHPFTCALLAAHNTVGKYQNGIKVHGGSGGNGMVTLDSSTGNEFSHEIGHNYGLGHYVGGFDGTVHRPAHEINSSWGWDSQTNTLIPNFSSSDTGHDQCLDDKCQAPFLGKYQYGKDAMGGGSPMWTGSNQFTMYTPHTSKLIQTFLEQKAVWDPSSSTGFRKFDPDTKTMQEYTNHANNQKVPRLFRVPVTTIVGYYEPKTSRNLESYIYPALHGAYGFVYPDDTPTTGASSSSTDEGCKLIIETSNNGVLVYDLSTTVHSQYMSKFHVNIATEDEPYEAKVECHNVLLAQRALDPPISNEGSSELSYTVTGAPFRAPTKNPTPNPTPEPTPNKCKDSTERFLWNKKKNKTKNCNWLRKRLTKNNGIVKTTKFCKRKDKIQKVRLWDWCPETCANVGLGKCVSIAV